MDEECVKLLWKLEDILETASYKADIEDAHEAQEYIDEALEKVRKFLRKVRRSERKEDTIEGWY